MPTGYPNSLPDGVPAKVYTFKAASEAVILAEEIVEFIATKLSFTNILKSYTAFVKVDWIESELRTKKN